MATKSVVRAIGGVMICMVAASCSREGAGAPIRIRIAGGVPDATFSIVATAIASLYSQRVPNVSAEAVPTTGTTDNIDAVETGEAECGLGSADLVYNAHLRGTRRLPRPHTHLRGLAVLFPNAIHLVTRSDSGLTTLADLAGKRVATAVPGDPSANGRGFRMDSVASTIADLAAVHAPPVLQALRIEDAVDQLERRAVDAAHFYGGYPFRPVTEAAQRYGIHFVEFDDLAISLVKENYPFSKSVLIPAGTYPGQASPVHTVGVDNVLFCRSELPADLVYRLTLTLYDGVAAIAAVHASAGQINPQNGAATPIPLHDGATRYYRERELFR